MTTVSTALRQPPHHFIELFEVAVVDLNAAAGIAMVDSHGQAKCVADAFFQCQTIEGRAQVLLNPKSVVGLTIAFIFRPQGLGVLFGMALFQVLLVVSTALPVMKKLKAGPADGLEGEAPQQ